MKFLWLKLLFDGFVLEFGGSTRIESHVRISKKVAKIIDEKEHVGGGIHTF